MRSELIFLLLTLASFASADTILYDNTATDTFNTILFSVGPYDGVGDRVELTSAGVANTASVQLFNAGGPGSFDAWLRFYAVGSPAGPQIGPDFVLGGLTAIGGDVIDLNFSLSALPVPKQVIFILGVTSVDAGVDLGVNMFEPPAVGSSDNTFALVANGSIVSVATTGENVFFQLRGVPDTTAVPEPGGLSTIGTVLLVMRLRKRRPESVTTLPDASLH
jgi:hypothetical protein